MIAERGVGVGHATVNRRVIKYSPQLEEAFRRRRRPVWLSWRMDETYVKVRGERMIKKGQMDGDEVEDLSMADQFYALAS